MELTKCNYGHYVVIDELGKDAKGSLVILLKNLAKAAFMISILFLDVSALATPNIRRIQKSRDHRCPVTHELCVRIEVVFFKHYFPQ